MERVWLVGVALEAEAAAYLDSASCCKLFKLDLGQKRFRERGLNSGDKVLILGWDSGSGEEI